MRDTYSSDFLKVLLTLENKILKDIKVATLAKVKKVNTTKMIVNVEPFPLLEGESSKTIPVKYFNQNSTFEIGETVVVLFLDRKFTNDKMTSNDELHSEKYGIILNVK